MVNRLAWFAICAICAWRGPTLKAPDRPFRRCRDSASPAAPTEKWRHARSAITVALGHLNHSAEDVVAKPSAALSLRAKFAYGTVSKDLEDELVRVWIHDCAAWRALGDHATDGDGRILVPAPARFGPGVYQVLFQVLGDGSMTTSFLWVLPEGTHLVVTDIDGTLTASDSELFRQIRDGKHVPVAYPFAAELTTVHARRGHVVVYLTGRPYWLTRKTRDWVANLAFAPGPLMVTDSNDEALPTESSVGRYKRARLQRLLDAGYVIDFAYGNAPTDIHAYRRAGIPVDRIWIIGANGGQMGTHPVAGSWQARSQEVEALPFVDKPFVR